MSGKQIKKSDEYITYRVVLAFIEAAVLLLLMSKLQMAIDTPTTYHNARAVCLIIAVAAGLCALLGAGGYIASVRRDTYRPGRVFNGMFLAAAALVVMACTLLLYYDHLLGMRLIYVLVPACALLFLVYSVYPKQLFVTSSTHAVAAGAFYVFYKLSGTAYARAALIVALAVCAGALVLYFATAKRGGCLRLLGVNFVIYGKHANRNYLLVLYAVTGLALVAAWLMGGAVAFYAMVATLLYIIGAIVHGTIKMM